MTETISGAIAKRENGPEAVVKQYTSDFTGVLPSHLKGETWMRLAQGVLRRDENLAKIAQRNPGSLVQALLECARLGHEPGSDSFYLVPMGNEIEGWEGYRGVIERMYRAGAVVSVKAEIVREHDVFVWQPGSYDNQPAPRWHGPQERPYFKVDWFGERGGILGAYAYAEMRGGGVSKVVVIDRTYLAKVRAMSRGSDKPSSPWQKWPESMALKTVVHRLEPFVPTSAEYIREQLRAHRDVANEHAPSTATPMNVSHLPEADPAVVDAELVEEQAAYEREQATQ